MPRGDGTGPWGMGPMTGRAAGYCVGYPAPGFMNPLPRRGVGRGFGMGMAWRRGFGGGRGARFGRGFGWRRWGWGYPAQPVYPTYPTPVYPAQSAYPVQPIPIQPFQTEMTKEQEIQFLEQDIRALEEERNALDQELGTIKKRLKELKK
jgi:hypothetical protein